MNSFIRCPVEYKLDDDEGQKSAAMAMEDRFSTLPQAIIHHIMSLLPTTLDTMALSMVSKTFSSAFLCFPIINFVDLKTNKLFFMDSVVNNFLQSRPFIPFDKLRFVGGLNTYYLSTYHRFNNMIDTMFRFSVDRNVKELVLNFGNTFIEPLHDQGLSLSLPPQLFSSGTIRDLRLIGISTRQLKCQDLIINSPSIENLRIIGCRFIRSVILGCNDKLKQVKIIHHTKIRVRGPTPCLEYLSCYCTLDARCKLDFTGLAFPKLKHLELNNYVTSPGPRINKQLDFSGFRSLETLKLFGSCGLKEIKFRLEYLNALHLCFVEFTKVEIEAPNLVSLTYKSKYYRTKPPEINISSSSTTLKHLDFQGKNVPRRWVAQNFSEFRVLETLKLINICRLKEIKFQLDNLNALKLVYVAFMKVEVEAPNLVSLIYESVTSTPPEINISSSSTNLKHLQFKGKYAPQRWVANDFSEFRALETLELHAYCLLKKVKIHLQCLKVLILSDMKLTIVEIEAPNLVSFVCKAKANMLVSPNLVTFTSKSKPDVILHVTSPLDPSHFPNMMNFIACLAHHCKTFTLRNMDSDYRGLIYPKELRKNLVHPLYNLKHLKVELVELVQSSLDQLVDSLLWLAPHPNTLSFIVGSQVKSLKFYYKNENLENRQHDLEEVVLQNFRGKEATILKKYFCKLLKGK